MVIISTRAVDVSIHAVSPVLIGDGWRFRSRSCLGGRLLGERRIDIGEDRHSERCDHPE